jgi:hypothetical protein
MRNRILGQGLLKLFGFFRSDGLGLPLIVVLGEKLYAIATASYRPIHGFVISSRNRLMGAEDGHFLTFGLGA